MLRLSRSVRIAQLASASVSVSGVWRLRPRPNKDRVVVFFALVFGSSGQ